MSNKIILKKSAVASKVPTISDWKDLESFIGIDSASYRLKSKVGWTKEITGNGVARDYNGDNLSGFNALPGGARGYGGDSDGSFFTAFWTSSLPLLPGGTPHPAVGESISISEAKMQISTFSYDIFYDIKNCL